MDWNVRKEVLTRRFGHGEYIYFHAYTDFALHAATLPLRHGAKEGL